MEDTRVKLWTLSFDEICTLVWGTMLIPYYSVLLSRSKLSELLSSKSNKPSVTKANLSPTKVRRLGIIINRVTRIFSGDGTCLLRSLILRHVLSRRNISSVIRLGVLPEQASFAAHAWVEVDGKPVNDTPDVAQRYLPFDGLSSSAELEMS